MMGGSVDSPQAADSTARSARPEVARSLRRSEKLPLVPWVFTVLPSFRFRREKSSPQPTMRAPDWLPAPDLTASPPLDVVAHMVRFSGALRNAGVPVALGDEIDATRSLAHIDIGDREEVRLGLRVALRVGHRAWPLFDHLFDRHWREGGPGPEDARQGSRRGRQERAPRRWPGHANPLSALAETLAERQRVEPAEAMGPDGGRPGYSPRTLLRRKSFEACTEDELDEMERLLARVARKLVTRRSRRLVPSRRGAVVDLRRSLRRSLAHGGELVDLARRERALELPRLVVLCDTSGSMDPYSRFLLTFVLALGKVARRTETFSFNTSLTRLTPWITSGNVQATLARFAARVDDWSGGTRIGECLREFADDHAPALVTGGTTVLILSDGLDRGDTGALQGALLVIRRRARRVIWLNPLMGDPRYRPEARGMKAALPHVDLLVPAHNVESLESLAEML
ncbi:MAG: VWA domain-containing protein [Gemmatimonadetes bacterium]|nr:VWA domain-containing protein [Gemmatimonadota bacterium]